MSYFNPNPPLHGNGAEMRRNRCSHNSQKNTDKYVTSLHQLIFVQLHTLITPHHCNVNKLEMSNHRACIQDKNHTSTGNVSCMMHLVMSRHNITVNHLKCGTVPDLVTSKGTGCQSLESQAFYAPLDGYATK